MMQRTQDALVGNVEGVEALYVAGLKRIFDTAIGEDILVAQAHGYWPCAAEGNDVILFDVDGQRELTRFSFPRQNKDGGLCIADFFRDVASNERDVIALQVVTMGRRASEAAREWFAENRYQDYLYLHGLSVEMAEVDCSGSSWSSSERVMPISSALSSANSCFWSPRLGQAG